MTHCMTHSKWAETSKSRKLLINQISPFQPILKKSAFVVKHRNYSAFSLWLLALGPWIFSPWPLALGPSWPLAPLGPWPLLALGLKLRKVGNYLSIKLALLVMLNRALKKLYLSKLVYKNFQILKKRY